MLTEEIRAQVITVLQARQLEDKAFREVMKISFATPAEEINRRAKEYEHCALVAQREERVLATLCIKEVIPESEIERT